MNQYIFTANFLGSNGLRIPVAEPDGSLLNSQFTPFTSNAQPTAVAAIPHNGDTMTPRIGSGHVGYRSAWRDTVHGSTPS